MKIIYPVPEIFPDPRARFIQVVHTCNALAKKGIEVTLMVGIKKGYPKERILEFYGVPEHPNLKVIGMPIMRREQKRYFRFSSHGVFNFFLLVHLLFRRSYRDGETVLFLRHIKLAGFIMKLRKFLRNPIVFEAHELFHFAVHHGRKRERIRELESKVYRRADGIISISRTIKEHLVNLGVPPEAIHVVHNGVEREWFTIERRPSGSSICYTGSLYSWKGVDTLIAAMKYLPDEKLLIVGGGKRMGELKRFAEAEGIVERVSFVGAIPRTEIPGYLSQSKVAVLPNTPSVPSQFSSPLKLFEYMACGIPIVASALPVFQEILIDERNAILFEPGNPHSLAAAIKKLIDNPGLAARIGNTAKEDARNYTYDKRAEKIAGLMEELLKRTRPSSQEDTRLVKI